MSELTIQAVFHKFCKHFAKEMYDKHIYLPIGNALAKVIDHYDRLGFTGAIGSTDVTHILVLLGKRGSLQLRTR